MLLVWTDYDRDAAILASYAIALRSLGLTSMQYMGPPQSSISSTVQAALQRDPQLMLIFFGHGSQSGLRGQDRREFVEIANAASLLKGRLVCAIACYSADAFGKTAALHGATVLGFRGQPTIPRRQPYAKLMEQCVLAGPKILIANGTATQARQETEAEFRKLARKLIRKPSLMDQIHASLMDLNGDRVDLTGDPHRTR